MESSYEEKLEAMKIVTEYARGNLSRSNVSSHVFSNCRSGILAVTTQNRKNYHNSNVEAIRGSL